MRAGLGIVVDHGLGGVAGGFRHTGLLRQRSLVGQASQLLAEVGQIHRSLGVGNHLLHTGADLARFFGQRGRHDVGGATHERTQLTRLLVKDEQLLGQRRLVVQHVDQKAQGTQVVAQGLEGTRFAGHRFIHFGVEDFVHRLSHAVHGLHGLVQPQNRQHAPHLAQLGRRHMQTSLFPRRAEELVQRFFRFTH